jgi:hypothetical protein
MDILEGMIDRGDIVGHVLDVVGIRGAGLLDLLPGQHVDERRLGAFDLRTAPSGRGKRTEGTEVDLRMRK